MRKLFMLVTALLISAFSFAQSAGLHINHLTGNFYVFVTYNTYNGIQTPANGMYMVTKGGVVMIDAPWNDAELQPLLDSIEAKHHKKVVVAIATHSHKDRSGGLEFFRTKGIKTYTTKLTDEISAVTKERRAEFTFSKDTTFMVGGYKFNTFYAGEGHTKDNLTIWFGKDKILYGGCLVKSVEATDLGYTGEANLQEWPKTILKLKQKYPNAKYVITGHQALGGTETLDHTLNLLNQKKG
ncbi:BlaB/IND/MUS family subclass B1 metallo-beta-lactamase [Pedobacter punctiformis]|uniref:beta-lactamase n=1 Tax=Pedobacter punctiformis TaxID=3004097 RepID=A0ABT4LBQ6_9SPHI|nr:BlaB/IND/MUS family subclass B1 metallo-beta-lactamase [Pedobacter sp. HCMS5-2]MCZ4245147.1 BlaB/IND/MUS family subclass B1 metallo-beta-lactamase [Pedobacter sp. HCMS5-2]